MLFLVVLIMPTLTVATAPVPTVMINNTGLSFVDGEITMVSCHVGASHPPANVTWYIGGKELGNGEITRNADGSTTSVLSHKASWLDQYKQLRCLAYNGYGNRKSHMIILYIVYPVSEITIKHKDNLTFRDGKVSLLTCQIGYSQPASNITWYLGSKNLGSGNITKLKAKTISILQYKATIKDNGKIIKCIASNGKTDPKCDKITLRIATPIPKISILNKTNLTFSDEQITTVTCQVGLSHPPSNITWYLDSDSLGGGNITKLMSETTSILEYRSTVKDDGKILQCTASDGETVSISDNITLRVEYIKPSKTQEALTVWTDTALIAGVVSFCSVCIFTICIITLIIYQRKVKNKDDLEAKADELKAV